MKALRIVHLRSSLGFYGAEALIEGLATGQQRAGHQVVVAGLVDLRQPHTELLERLEQAQIPTARLLSEGRLAQHVPERVAELLRHHKADLLHTHDYKTVILGGLGASLARVPVVSTFHGEVADDGAVRAYEAAARAALRCYHGVALVSRAQRARFRDPLRRRAPVFLPNAVDVQGLQRDVASLRQEGRLAAWRGSLGIPEGAVVVGTVGRVCQDKGQLAALEAVARVMRRQPRLHWIIAGEGPQMQALRQQILALGLEGRVHLLGYTRERPLLYGAMELLLHPSFREGLPMVILEAMACAVPVLASPVGEIPGAVPASCGLLLEDRGDALERALERLVVEVDTRAEMGQAAARRALQEYSVERLAQRYTRELYLPALGG